MAKRDFLQRELFLQRLEQWRADPTEYLVELLLQEHIFPLARHVMGRAVWLSREDQDTAISEAVKRCWGALGTYDPERHPPFKFFGRICYNERLRAGSLKKEREKRETVESLDVLFFEDSKSTSSRLDAFVSCGLTVEDFDWRRLWCQIPQLSEAHSAVFNAAVHGDFVQYEGRLLRTGRVCKETLLPKWAVTAALLEIKALVGGRPVEGIENVERLRNLWQDQHGRWWCDRCGVRVSRG